MVPAQLRPFFGDAENGNDGTDPPGDYGKRSAEELRYQSSFHLAQLRTTHKENLAPRGLRSPSLVATDRPIAVSRSSLSMPLLLQFVIAIEWFALVAIRLFDVIPLLTQHTIDQAMINAVALIA